MSGPRSLRARLTLVFTGVAATVVLVAAAGMMVLIEHTVWDPLDAMMEEEAETLATIHDLGSFDELNRAVVSVGSERDVGEKFIRVTAAGGRVLAESGKVPAAVASLPPPATGGAPGTTIGGPGDRYRVVWFALPDGGWTEVGVAVDAQVQTLRRARLAIGATAVGLLALFALLAWKVTTRATAELERLAAELETLEAGSLDRRLTPRRTSEVDRLVHVLNRLLARLESAMAHLRRFTADAAHELRTPIAALRARLEVAIGRTQSSEVSRDGLLDALEQTERLGQLAEDLLTLSAVEAGAGGAGEQTSLVRLDELVHEVGEFLEPVAQEQGRRFACRVEHPLAVRGAPDLLKRLLLNLVDNAFRHTPPAAAVDLCVHARDGLVTLEVRDQGPGIPPAELALVFERFRRGRGGGAGTGLGLALCREIAVRHGGQIGVESTPGVGTTFTVTLPLAEPAGL